jgi:hypothetical protein
MRAMIFLFFILVVDRSLAQVNKDWVNDDISLINNVKALDKQNLKEVEAFFVDKKYRNPRTNLGFGWSTFTLPVAKPGGYTSVYADLYYFHDCLTSYILTCHIPHDSLLWRQYMEMYWEVFTPDSNAVFFYKYNEDALTQTVGEIVPSIKSSAISRDLVEYMLPSAGIVYGNRGGISNSLLQNRRHFNMLKLKLNYEQIVILMHSVNPASRFTAIEYYQRHKKRFSPDAKIEAWIKKVYDEVPIIATMSGCSMGERSSRELVSNFSRLKRDPE